MTEENLEEAAKRKGLRGTLGSAREAIGGSLDKVSGAAFRRQFEQFTNVVEKTVVGIHGDQQELNKRLEMLESSKASPPPTTPPTQKLVVAAIILSVIAAILAIWALLVTTGGKVSFRTSM